ncbi:uroporphyrinogen-III synthase [Cellulomonas sp. ATA003]|uniref:uroporphyrinogen-III synthase n=1 Tax=Cellulomonas sp. ATA003 TaxID=3073064 RepID=UPI00287334F2|nr:uroporphyrinogen-III synthase [Cellulomonas sp. ATA003]WNB85682.1 uroporphyrinogen-III synthase [Cellulomonas sp. ATA003]
MLVPRAPERAGALIGALRRAGAEPVAAPLVHIGPPDDLGALDDALARLAAGRYDWLSVTSGFTVDALDASAARAGRTLGDVVRAGRAARPGSTRVAAVGDATAAALRRAGVDVDFVPAGEQSARGMLAEWPEPSPGALPAGRCTVLVPQGDLAEPTLTDGLTGLGMEPEVVTSYRNNPAPPLTPELVADLASGAVGGVVLTSGSTARRLADQVTLPPSTLVCCIGPRTAEVAAELGLPVGLVAQEPHPRAVVEALVRGARDRPLGGEGLATTSSPHPPTTSRPTT